jgi:hypothetical protein
MIGIDLHRWFRHWRDISSFISLTANDVEA